LNACGFPSDQHLTILPQNGKIDYNDNKGGLETMDQLKGEENQFDLVGQANIKVIGCGGAGNNMVNWLYKKGVRGAEIIACNTDQQHLNIIEADKKFLLGKDVTRGLGCGGFPEKGAEAAQESIQEIKEALKGADMVFVCAGMGGGTGTGSAPVVAETAKGNGAIVIGTVTMPFKIERARVDKAEFGLQQLRNVSDTVIVIDNNRLVAIAGNLPVQQAFAVANELVATMIKGIVETIAIPSLVNLDYADVKAIMTDGGVAAIGVGASDTNNRVEEAVKGALSNPLLDISYEGATGAILHVSGGPDMTLDEISRVGELVTESMDEDANVIWGARVSEGMKGKLTVMTIITGVKSPWILGRQTPKQATAARKRLSDELGIEIVR
jgi:cell division protein FtsZ